MLLPTAGILAALWTPTDAAGRVVEAGLAANLAFLRGHGVHGLMVLGSTGEFVRLPLAARLEFIELVRRHAADLPANGEHQRRSARRRDDAGPARRAHWAFRASR